MIKIICFKIFILFIIITLSFTDLVGQSRVKKELKKTEGIIITIEFKEKPSQVIVEKAALKFNKEFAYSFTIDDGLVSAYKDAYPLFGGGQISGSYIDAGGNDQGGDGSVSSGLFYTNGCGQQIPFKAALCVNAKSIPDKDDQPRYNCTWNETKELYDQGWDLLNHGYAHATEDGTDFNYEVIQNEKVTHDKLGVTFRQFVIPGGKSSPGYEKIYTDAAFKNGLDVVYNNGTMGPLIQVDKPFNLKNLTLNREYTTSTTDAKELYKSKETILNLVTDIDSKCKNGDHFWFHEFTHSVGNTNLWSISLTFDVFKYYMSALAKLYGLEGKDNMWMAPCQEVYEYLAYRDASNVSQTIQGNKVIIRIDSKNIPQNLRRRALTLKLSSDKNFKILKVQGLKNYSYNGKGNNKLINLEAL